MAEERTTGTRRRSSLRKLLYTPLAVGVIAGTVCAGTGIGIAAPGAAAASTSTPDSPLESGDIPGYDWWTLKNETGESIYGEWSTQVGSTVSELKITSDWPLKNGGFESRPTLGAAFRHTYWMGHICYQHTWWNLDRYQFGLDIDGTFTLTVGFAGLFAEWNSNPYSKSGAFLVRNWADGSC
ncbi:hypothetical protein R3Q06_17645 [Rhodococcus erythropolis]|uniref:hypothetical protein n=1 Tax=Rhodococcus erythropolis TaxID=1833 RepID=UPI002948E57F|nr:hypothetical protein [Rhodococcus erythropolis]MDV6275323.1 hypothetical protein [Rhodococcus erythropolis]